MSPSLDILSLPGPCDPGFGVAGEGDLDAGVLALVKERGVAEPDGKTRVRLISKNLQHDGGIKSGTF